MRKISNGERVWTAYLDNSGKIRYLITSKATRDYYYLYECTEDGLRKLGRAQSPKELEERFKVEEVILGKDK